MTGQSGEALEVLREVWRSQGQGVDDLADCEGSQKTCKKMADVGFEDFGAGEADLNAAWRARLEREGKLVPAADSIRDLVMGPSAESRR